MENAYNYIHATMPRQYKKTSHNYRSQSRWPYRPVLAVSVHLYLPVDLDILQQIFQIHDVEATEQQVRLLHLNVQLLLLSAADVLGQDVNRLSYSQSEIQISILAHAVLCSLHLPVLPSNNQSIITCTCIPPT